MPSNVSIKSHIIYNILLCNMYITALLLWTFLWVLKKKTNFQSLFWNTTIWISVIGTSFHDTTPSFYRRFSSWLGIVVIFASYPMFHMGFLWYFHFRIFFSFMSGSWKDRLSLFFEETRGWVNKQMTRKTLFALCTRFTDEDLYSIQTNTAVLHFDMIFFFQIKCTNENF